MLIKAGESVHSPTPVARFTENVRPGGRGGCPPPSHVRPQAGGPPTALA
jgi:hypothetical protein